MNRAGLGAAMLGATLLAACDGPSEVSEASPSPIPTVTTTTTATGPASSPSTTVIASTVNLPATAATAAAVPTSLGPLTFEVAVGAVVDPRPQSSLPEFVTANARWIVPGQVSFGVTIETIIPPMPAGELVDEFDANGLSWRVFDSGPRNGSLAIAMTTIDTMSVLISAQSWTWDPTAVPRTYVEDLARTVQHRAP